MYTVKEVSELSKVTVKTLHHYHKIGLLPPCMVTDAGYRLYGTKELERLQQILFYRELDFPLDTIKRLLEQGTDRLTILRKQENLLNERKGKLDQISQTLRNSIRCMEKGEVMDNKEMFRGFGSESEWKEALSEQSDYLKDTYNYDLEAAGPINVEQMNEQAAEAVAFMSGMAAALKDGAKHNDEAVKRLIGDHLLFLNGHGHVITAEDFAAQSRFFLSDDFHLRMLENQQTGLAYYLSAAADAYAAGK